MRPYWQEPQVSNSYVTSVVQHSYKPYICESSCRPHVRTVCPGIVKPLPLPDAIM